MPQQMTQPFYAVLLPSYKPDERLVSLCKSLREKQMDVLVVDDGSGTAFRAVFQQVEALGIPVVRHATNLGKGRALKTGINDALLRYPALSGVVTADGDGQHTPEDILCVMEAMRKKPDALVLGSRAFEGEVPWKSRAGNAITRVVYRFVTGIRCYDTQTGLRGIPTHALPKVLSLAGERYEFEMMMLMKLREMQLDMIEVPIATIYLDDNSSSHFNPWRDSVRIYSVILKFLLNSLLSFAVDYGIYLLLLGVPGNAAWVSYAVARALSSTFNYWLNRASVFGSNGNKGTIWRYYLLAAVLLAAGTGLVQWLVTAFDVNAKFIKIPVDIALFFVSYLAQREFVFHAKQKKKVANDR